MATRTRPRGAKAPLSTDKNGAAAAVASTPTDLADGERAARRLIDAMAEIRLIEPGYWDALNDAQRAFLAERAGDGGGSKPARSRDRKPAATG